MTDARFEDGREAPLNLGALDPEDLKVISALAQDAIFPITEMRWLPARRRFALLINRFRWEDRGRDRHGAERVQSLLYFDNVLRVSSQGIDRNDKDMILSLLALDWEPSEDPEDPSGALLLTLAGDGALRLTCEALGATLRDVTRPYKAPSRHVPHHPVD
ncbi:DUF2948 family protein [Rhodalgimonas zhirmunskyi]|uniref:DUF2948 family protein n=1 Tax=Rhodalgimonas zhirmunskyi TaxID=2964767 RepID=A0AAJ1UC77_9RHOB|nr:DUF2948 family protein [Rhodoalgimonas zhirmunskyi]MDQ2094848.1 DUF2948 family protein [Rhodoalgimonas zhirmunskyi]